MLTHIVAHGSTHKLRRRPPGSVGYEVSSAELKRKLEFSKAKPRIDDHGATIKHEQKRFVQHRPPDLSKVQSKIGQSMRTPYQKHGGDIQIKYGIVKKRKLPPLRSSSEPDRHAQYQKRKEIFREYTVSTQVSPERTSDRCRQITPAHEPGTNTTNELEEASQTF
eukprot:gene9760-1962_t